MTPTTPGRPTTVGAIAWLAHAVLLLLLGAYAGWAAATPAIGANIGLGLGLLAVALLGAPWTIPVFISGATFDGATFAVVAGLGALLNLALHAAWWRWRARRRTP